MHLVEKYHIYRTNNPYFVRNKGLIPISNFLEPFPAVGPENVLSTSINETFSKSFSKSGGKGGKFLARLVA